jgi:hypothetical protein
MKKMNVYLIASIFASILVIIFSYLSNQYEGGKAEKKFNQTINEQTEEINTLTSKNLDLTSQLIEQSKIISSSITGGDGFCYITLHYTGVTQPRINYQLHYSIVEITLFI